MITFTLFVVAVLAAIGMSHIIVDGDIFAKWRGDIVMKYKNNPNHWMVKLVTCYQCTGLWSGVFMSLFLQPIHWYALLSPMLLEWFTVTLCIPLYLVITPFIVGCASSYCSMAGAAFLNYLDAPAMAAAALKRNNESNKT